MNRSKSTNLHRNPLKNSIETNKKYAGILEPLINLKYSRVSSELQHRPYMQLAQLLTKYNNVLKNESTIQNKEAQNDWQEICGYAQSKCEDVNMNYFISKLDDKQNKIKFYEQKLEEIRQSGRENNYKKDVKRKAQQLENMMEEQQKQAIRNKNKLEKLLAEYNVEEKQIKSMKKQIIKLQLKLREHQKKC